VGCAGTGPWGAATCCGHSGKTGGTAPSSVWGAPACTNGQWSVSSRDFCLFEGDRHLCQRAPARWTARQYAAQGCTHSRRAANQTCKARVVKSQYVRRRATPGTDRRSRCEALVDDQRLYRKAHVMRSSHARPRDPLALHGASERSLPRDAGVSPDRSSPIRNLVTRSNVEPRAQRVSLVGPTVEHQDPSPPPDWTRAHSQQGIGYFERVSDPRGKIFFGQPQPLAPRGDRLGPLTRSRRRPVSGSGGRGHPDTVPPFKPFRHGPPARPR